MLQIARSTGPAGVAYCMVMRCGNCRRPARSGFVVPAGTPGAVQAAADEAALEIWGAFACEACDYDKAYVITVRAEAPVSPA